MPSTEAEDRPTSDQSQDWLHIAVAVISDSAGNILISERKPDCAYAGQWEFPGGKVEEGETVELALRREISEELGLKVSSARPLIGIRHEYPDRKVWLDTWRVTMWSGEACALEGQRFDWVTPGALDDYPMLAANRPIVRASQLPDRYLVTPACEDEAVWFDGLRSSLEQGISLVRLRQVHLDDAAYGALAREVLSLCREYGAQLMVDRKAVAKSLGTGLHLTAQALGKLQSRPIEGKQWLAASCHNLQELQRAAELGCDFAMLGTVQATASHPVIQPMGWQRFSALVGAAALPVYAIGGLTPGDLPQSWASGGQGIAAIRGLWADR